MPTPAERRALLFVAAVAALGVGVRGVSSLGDRGPPPSARESLARQLSAVDSVIASGGRKQRPSRPTEHESAARDAPLGKGNATVRQRDRPATPEKPPLQPASVDMDRATVDELDRLPGIGPALAERIVADRTARGPFGSIDGLQRVKGVGPALAARMQPYVTFSLPPRPSDTGMSSPGVRRRP
ncbi:MAG: ComEA family DNA-binding protein [Gemmatimonadaceae bacterium]